MNIAAARDDNHLPVADQRRLLDGTGDLRAPPDPAARRIDEQHFATDAAELVFRTDSASEWVRLPMQRDSVAWAAEGGRYVRSRGLTND